MIQIIIGAVAIAAALALVYFTGRLVTMLGNGTSAHRHDGVKARAERLQMKWRDAGDNTEECFAVGAGTILILAFGIALLWLIGSIIMTCVN